MARIHAVALLGLLLAMAPPARSGEGESTTGALGRAAGTAGHDAGRFLTSPLRIDRRAAIMIGGIAATTGLIYAYDEEILEGFERSRGNRFYDLLIDTGEATGDAGQSGRTFPFFAGALLAGHLSGCEPLTVISAELLEYQLIPGLFRSLVKGMIGRPRPGEKRDPRYFEFGGGHSTPSGHASNMFALATVLSHRIASRPVGAAGYLLATCVSLQRIDGESHWPSDVFLGAVYGTVSARFLMKLHDAKGGRLEPVALPERGFAGVCIRIPI